MTLPISTDDMPRLLVLLVLSAVIGWMADLLAGGRVPLGFFGSILFGVLGAWVATEVVRPRIPLTMPTEPSLDGVMLITAAVGALLFSLAWCLLSSRVARNFR